MRSPHILNLRNPREVKNQLSDILNASALDSIEAEIKSNVSALFKLAAHHYRFAIKQSRANWRQRVSRLYYAAYNAARAVRLYVDGDYSTSPKDHQKVNKLPQDFPNRSTYVNQLSVLRDDRNVCDYDHILTAKDLVLGTQVSTALVCDFLRDVRTYLGGRGLSL